MVSPRRCQCPEKWQGKFIDKFRTDNSRKGADRIVNSVEIQTRYYAVLKVWKMLLLRMGISFPKHDTGGG